MPVSEEDRKNKHHHHHHDEYETMPHVHTYLTEVDVADEHQHIIMGISGPAKEKGRSHVHRIHGRTSFISEEDEGGHWHSDDVMTGPAIDMPEGTHVHYFEGMTSEDDGHCHSFAGVTGLGPCLDMDTDTEDECEEEEEDECIEVFEDECEEECEIPVKTMPKYKHKHPKRPGEE